MAGINLRTMTRADWPIVAELIYDSTNAWYVKNGRSAIFSGPRENAQLFCQVYEDLDPGCCILAEDTERGGLAGSCFYHTRAMHVSLGIMNVHPDYFGRGVGRKLLKHITDIADLQRKPMRLVSSAVNMDSFSLYNRAGFVPRVIYQDMTMKVPEGGFAPRVAHAVRTATLADVPQMAALELELNHIIREADLRYFVERAATARERPPAPAWHVSVCENERGGIDGFLVSVAHTASNMLGPGVARTESHAIALIAAELQQNRGRQPVWLVPAHCEQIVRTMYEWGAKNCELHFAQARGAWKAPTGVVMPTFMPETG